MWDLWGKLDQARGAELNDVITRAARRLNDGEATANAKADALHQLATRRPRPPASATRRSTPVNRPGSATRPSTPAATSAGDTTGRSTPAGAPTSRPGTATRGSASTGDAMSGSASGDDLLDGFDPGAGMGVGYIVDAATLARGPHESSVAQTWDGHSMDPATVAHLACDTDLYAILYDTVGQPTQVGRTRRAATRTQRLQLRGLYDRCPLDGTPFGDCDMHHVNLPWEAGGETELDNLLPISQAWHRVNPSGSQSSAKPNSLSERSERRRPDGQLHRDIPPPRPISRE